MLNTLISQVLPDGTTPHGWFKKIEPFYRPFVKAIWTNQDALKVLFKETRGVPGRLLVLFRYWALKKVTTLEEAKALVKVCPFCGENYTIPASVSPKSAVRETDWMVGCCHRKYCAGKFKNSRTTQGMIRIHGVANANDMPGMRAIKSGLLKEANVLRKNEILALREKTCQERYNVDNVSQIDDIKTKKAMTSFENYGVYNPQFNSEINIKRALSSLRSSFETIWINGKEFFIRHVSEGTFVNMVSKYIPVQLLEVNSKVLERQVNGRSKLNIVDLAIADIFFIELKSASLSFTMTENEYMRDRLGLILPLLKCGQRYMFYMMGNAYRAVFIVRNYIDMNILTTLNSYEQLVTCFGKTSVDKAFNNPRTKIGLDLDTFDDKFFSSIQGLLVRQGVLRYQTNN